MSGGFSFRPVDLPRFEAIVGQILARTDDLSPLMERIGMYGESSTIERFSTEIAPDGSKWATSIRARVEGGKTLTDSARGKQSITYIAGPNFAEWGTNVFYMAVHQAGATIRAKDGGRLAFRLPGNLRFVRPEEVILPKREFIGLSGEDDAELVALGEDYLGEVLQ